MNMIFPMYYFDALGRLKKRKKEITNNLNNSIFLVNFFLLIFILFLLFYAVFVVLPIANVQNKDSIFLDKPIQE